METLDPDTTIADLEAGKTFVYQGDVYGKTPETAGNGSARVVKFDATLSIVDLAQATAVTRSSYKAIPA